jgi:hypothetical protein
MKKNIAIIILSVCLAVTILASAALGLYQHIQLRWTEMQWGDYLSWCSLFGYDANYLKVPEGVPHTGEVIRCMYNESFDRSIPDDPLPEKESYGPSGTYFYDIFIGGNGGYLVYQQWGEINTEVEEGHWTSRHVLFHESVTPLTAEEVQSVLTVMKQEKFGRFCAPNPYLTVMDGDTTYVMYSTSPYFDDLHWSGHMISERNAEAGDPCYEIRKAIEKLVIDHGAGPVPVNAKQPS